MLETSARLLRLLSLLQVRREWSGTELAARLDVSTRTIRNDIDKLRALGYPVDATPGVHGGYRLGAGAELPPLLLDDDEAVAVALGLRTAATGAVEGIEESSVRALAKLEQVLPHRLRRRVAALQDYTMSVPFDAPAPAVDAAIVTVLAAACRDRERVRFAYRSHDGTETRRAVEPHRLVRWGRRWFLVAWDRHRRDWRTFRIDRIRECVPVGARFGDREPPAADLTAYVARQVSVAPRTHQARILLHGSFERLRERIPAAAGTLVDIDGRACVLNTSANSLNEIAVNISMIGVDFDIIEPAELITHVRDLAERYARAASAGDSASPSHPVTMPNRRRSDDGHDKAHD
ncbi:YafY family transcriptional regulator [Actinobacteria bacterium YIM 96077]|uniref:DNA-binding transcriptional regulator n=1 Tax=Phytoactinopolyspora halophila TaxID=1981511 RepID=A0A329QYL7_9ACTN|nr:YafY family protein [Phytoactinopolyspora halophila]AYY13295.1 YafY family transcriptional regulator [Actinobacteria bacterium YIM 96077]RAW17470.1 DNA-binding transcriptional regulator [Phytoactinopolyspora halophila]